MPETQASQTTRTMAYLLMGLFGLCLVSALAAAIALRDDNRWFTAFKDGFAFLAGALATIIGYYFGNRNTDAAYEKAREATDKVKDANARVEVAEAKAEALKKEIIDVTEMDDPVIPSESPVRDDCLLDKPLKQD